MQSHFEEMGRGQRARHRRAVAFTFDIAGNEMANTVGGGLQYIVGKLVGALLSFFTGPFIAGTVMGFFIGMVTGIFEDLSIFLQIGEMFEGLTKIGELIPTLISNPGMIWEMIKDSIYGIINKAFNFNPFGQGGYTAQEWFENITALASDFFDNWNIDDEELQNFISAEANQFNLAFTAAHMVGYIIQQLMIGGFMLLGKFSKAAGIAGKLGDIASSLKKAAKSIGGFLKDGASKVAKLIKKGLLEPAAEHIKKLIDKLGGIFKWGDEAVDYASAGMGKLAVIFGDDLDNIMKQFDPEDWQKYCELMGKADKAEKASAIKGLINHAANSPEWAAKGDRFQLDRIYAYGDKVQDVEKRFKNIGKNGRRVDAILDIDDVKKVLECKHWSDRTLRNKWDDFIDQITDYSKLDLMKNGEKTPVIVEFGQKLDDANLVKLNQFKMQNSWFDYTVI